MTLKNSKVDIIINPAITGLDSGVCNSVGTAACPVAMSNPDVVKAAFTNTADIFKKYNTEYCAPVFHMDIDDMFENELYKFFSSLFDIKRSKSRLAFNKSWDFQNVFFKNMQNQAKETLNKLVVQKKVGVLFLGRPYHYDSGLNHEIMINLQRRGYPIFVLESLPKDEEYLSFLFDDDIKSGVISDPLEINDVWKHSLSENTSRKVWGAKFAARHPNLAIVDFSSFRCGLDATILHVIENIARCSKTPYFTFYDMDQNKPSGSLMIRLETIDYFLKEYTKKL